MRKFSCFFFIFFLTAFMHAAYAVLNLELTQGAVGALPIAIVPFAGQNGVGDATNLAAIISQDLKNSGRFKVMSVSDMPQLPHDVHEVNFAAWQKTGNDSIVIGSIQLDADKIKVNFSLLDAFKGTKTSASPIILSQQFVVSPFKLRTLAHHISDLIYYQLIGERGIFSTKIAYVLVKNEQGRSIYRLEVADIDGYNPRPILTSPDPIMSPAWSHDSKRIAYVSFENRHAQIYINDVMTGQRHLISRFSGINGAPFWSPDDTKLALVLSKSGSPKIYTLNLLTHQLQQITSGSAIDTEPSFAPDGKSIFFTSDRGGSPEVYQINLANGHVQRVTFVGNYNAKATLAPNMKTLVMLHAASDGYAIAALDRTTGNVSLLTRSGRDESPSLAPNGSMVLYGTEYGDLGLVSIDGNVTVRLPNLDGKVQSPAWSGFVE